MAKDRDNNVVGWIGELRRRFGIWWFLKMTGTICVMSLFFAGYFWVLRNPGGPVTIMPRIFLDEWIGFIPATLPFYLSLWLYVGLLPALYKNFRELVHYVIGVFGLGLIGLSVFYWFPTAVSMVEEDRAQGRWFVLLKRMDASGNACPSLHVAFAVFTAIGFSRLLQEVKGARVAFIANILWSAAICFSTVAIRQHVVLDLIAGTILGWIAGEFVFSKRWKTWQTP